MLRPRAPPGSRGGLQAVREVLTLGGSITVIEGDHGSAYVLTYTSAPLDRDVEVVGEVSAEIWSQSSTPFADVFVRLCDVDARGRSRNVCDGLTSLTGADQVTCASVRLWPTAHRFLAGHRIRIQVCSGAFPRYARGDVGMWTSRQTRVEGRARVDRAAGLRRGPAARRRITREG
ncbi:MAG: CocE/NonD family hydrolase [Candidatus Dormibacteraeota bacterium]|nr:CocE/NonD family hydrolase [Candidatus Dormibacteraeota bacterium]